MIYLTQLLLLLISAAQASNPEIIKTFQKCIPTQGLTMQVRHEQELRRDLQRPDLSMKFLSGYSKNEISSANPERMQYGVMFRWNDLVDSERRQELQEQTGQLRTQEAKITLETFWRNKLSDMYFRKWGLPLKKFAEDVSVYAEQKLAAGSGNLGTLATTRTYSDLLELSRVATDFVGKLDALDREFLNCRELDAWKTTLDYTSEEVTQYAVKKSSRLVYQEHSCNNQKTIKTIYNRKEAGTWTVALNSSFVRNRLLRDENNQFNDVRAGLELNIPITGINTNDVVVDVCDYDTRTAQSEDLTERNFITAMYPVLVTMEKQYKELSTKVKVLIDQNPKFSAPMHDVVLMSLNLFQLHKTLSEGEAKVNARIIPSKIVEDAL